MPIWPKYRELLPSELILVALDTTVLRDLCYGEAAWSSAFNAMARNGFAFCFADTAAAEITAQLSRGAISREQLASGIDRAQTFVYPHLPFLPGARELNVMTGGVDASGECDLSEVAAHLRGLWDLLGDTTSDARVYDHKGQQYRIALEDNTAAEVLSAERAAWCEHFDRLRAIPKATLSPADNLNLLRQEVDREVVRGLPLSSRLDLQLKHLYYRHCHHNAVESAYNPRSKRRRNDGIDFNLLYALLGPALIVTRDERLIVSIQEIQSYQASWVMSPEQLAKAGASGMLKQPVWQDAV